MAPERQPLHGRAVLRSLDRSDTSVRTEGAAAGWSATYVRARELEGRLYPDTVVARLPDVPPSDPLASEWRLRADSAARFLAHLDRQPRPFAVLEVGCGNGWLANQIAGVEGSRVVGVDVNELELAQARRVFGGRPNLHFIHADITIAAPPMDDPTVIVLASVAQYLAELAPVIRRLRSWLPPDGELHVLDTPFYASGELEGARERSRRHYMELGVPEMVGVYHHHDRAVLEEFEPELLYAPDSIRARMERRLLGRPRSPFPWFRIRGPGAAERAPRPST